MNLIDSQIVLKPCWLKDQQSQKGGKWSFHISQSPLNIISNQMKHVYVSALQLKLGDAPNGSIHLTIKALRCF